jgi:regulatory protein
VSGRRERPEPDAYSVAIGLLARREHSVCELQSKLRARGIAAEDADAAIERLAEQGLQDEARFAEMLVRTRMGAGQGPMRIRAELNTHGLASELIEAAFDENAADWDTQARAIIERRYRADELADPALRRKAIEFLLRRGFELDMARRACAPETG